MANTLLYNDKTRVRTKLLTTEDSFSKGMKTTTAFLESGYVKTLCNFDLKNAGAVLRTRAALRTLDLDSTFTGDTLTKIHSAGIVKVKKYTAVDKYTYVYLNAALIATTAIPTTNYYPKTALRLALVGLTDGIVYTTTLAELRDETVDATTQAVTYEAEEAQYVSFTRNLSSMHDLDNASDYSEFSEGVSTSIASVIYMTSYFTAYGAAERKTGIAKLEIVIDTAGTVTWDLLKVEPRDVQPAQAINYGYNMLKKEPYTFTNKAVSGALTLTGVVPYDESGDLLLTARSGTAITFKLFYKYPSTATVDPNERYYVQWEMYDLSASATASTVIQDMTQSPVYVPGDNIELTYTPTAKQFSLIVKIFKLSDINENDVTIDLTEDLKALLLPIDTYIVPERIMTLASYYLLSDDNSSTQNLDVTKYDMGTAAGMASWGQRLVFWGVEDAKNMLFTTDINSTNYVPYPNGIELFNTEVLCAVQYMSKLIVFTTSTIHLLTLNSDGYSFSNTVVRDKLSLNAGLHNTVQVIQNMVYFKSSNYYYMIVPKAQSLTGELQLAPISSAIELFLDNFKTNVTDMLDNVYALTDSRSTLDVEFLDLWTTLSDSQVRNYYKLKVTKNYIGDTVPDEPHYINFCLIYDTVIRSWTTYIYESVLSRDVIINASATGNVRYMLLNGDKCVVYKEDLNEAKDDHIDNIVIPNYQFIDTGFRAHTEELKRRYREVQFSVNALTDASLKFYTSFFVDADERKAFFTHEVVHYTDPLDAKYGTIVVERIAIDPLITPSVTELDGSWVLNTSMFPDLSVSKIRYKVSGKGYGGRVQLISVDTVPYELLSISWVYRLMYPR